MKIGLAVEILDEPGWEHSNEIAIKTIVDLLNERYVSTEDMESRIEVYCLEIGKQLGYKVDYSEYNNGLERVLLIHFVPFICGKCASI